MRRVMLEDVDGGREVGTEWESPTAEVLKRRLTHEEPTTMIMVVDCPHQPGRIAAFAVGTVDERLPSHTGGPANSGYLYSVGTDRGKRGRGYATAVVKALLDWFSHQEVRRVSLHGSDNGMEVYRKLGFEDNPWPELRFTFSANG